MENKLKIETLTKNKKAYFDYEVLHTYEAWIDLFWHEVKSIRNWHLSIKGTYVSFVWWFCTLKWMQITPWKSLPNRESIPWNRDRKIFLHNKDLSYLKVKQKEAWLSIIALEVYLKWSLIKVKVWLCKWRKEYDKKQVLKERSMDKEAKIYLKKFTW
jgi:SsrA-binding protein